jgi:hypothetical protein
MARQSCSDDGTESESDRAFPPPQSQERWATPRNEDEGETFPCCNPLKNPEMRLESRNAGAARDGRRDSLRRGVTKAAVEARGEIFLPANP